MLKTRDDLKHKASARNYVLCTPQCLLFLIQTASFSMVWIRQILGEQKRLYFYALMLQRSIKEIQKGMEPQTLKVSKSTLTIPPYGPILTLQNLYNTSPNTFLFSAATAGFSFRVSTLSTLQHSPYPGCLGKSQHDLLIEVFSFCFHNAGIGSPQNTQHSFSFFIKKLLQIHLTTTTNFANEEIIIPDESKNRIQYRKICNSCKPSMGNTFSDMMSW